MSSPKKPTKRRSPQELLNAVQERLDATPERLARAKEAGETPSRDADRKRRMLDPFDTMRANRVLAPNDPKLNDIRWLVGESLRRTHHRARLDHCVRSPPTGSARPASGRDTACRRPTSHCRLGTG